MPVRTVRKKFIRPSEGIFSKNYGADQQRLQISDLHFDKFPNPATSACWKIRFKTEVCTCSQFPTEAMLWIKEVEMVDSVDDLKSSSSVRGIRVPYFAVLDARIASALNRIIHNSHLIRRVSLEEQKALPGHWSERYLIPPSAFSFMWTALRSREVKKCLRVLSRSGISSCLGPEN